MKEIRSIEGSEFRIIPNSRKIEGYALLFDTLSQDLGGFVETIASEALNGVLEVSDVLALFNHEENKVLARNTYGTGTLTLNIDKKGLIYSFDAPKTPLGDEVFDAIKRGDLRNSSFAFTLAEGGDKWERIGNIVLRTITKFDKIYDTSPVFRPAYLDTTVAARSLDKLKNEMIVMEENRDIINKCEMMDQMNSGDTMNSMENEPVEPDEMIDIMYDGNTYSIPKKLVESYITKQDSLRIYFEELESDVEQLKKQY